MLLPKLVRVRCQRHMAWVATLPCTHPRCRRYPCQVHHLTCSPDPKARGLKCGDNWTVSLCFRHHNDLHMRGDERAFWHDLGVDPVARANELWAASMWAGRAINDEEGNRDV